MTTRKLYWVWTADHERDWFQVALSPKEAERSHCQRHGYDSGDAHARFVAELPEHWQGAEIGRPKLGVLEACGGQYLGVESNKESYRFGDDVFTEGKAVRSAVRCA